MGSDPVRLRVRIEHTPVSQLSSRVQERFSSWLVSATFKGGRMNAYVVGDSDATLFLQAAVTYYFEAGDTSTLFTTHRQLWRCRRLVQDMDRRGIESDESLEVGRALEFFDRYDLVCIDDFGAVTDEALSNTWWEYIMPRVKAGRYPTLLAVPDSLDLPEYILNEIEKNKQRWYRVIP